MSSNYIVNHELQIGDTLNQENIFTKYPNINEYSKTIMCQSLDGAFEAQIALTPICISASSDEILIVTKLNISDMSKSIYLKFEEEQYEKQSRHII